MKKITLSFMVILFVIVLSQVVTIAEADTYTYPLDIAIGFYGSSYEHEMVYHINDTGTLAIYIATEVSVSRPLYVYTVSVNLYFPEFNGKIYGVTATLNLSEPRYIKANGIQFEGFLLNFSVPDEFRILTCCITKSALVSFKYQDEPENMYSVQTRVETDCYGYVETTNSPWLDVYGHLVQANSNYNTLKNDFDKLQATNVFNTNLLFLFASLFTISMISLIVFVLYLRRRRSALRVQ